VVRVGARVGVRVRVRVRVRLLRRGHTAACASAPAGESGGAAAAVSLRSRMIRGRSPG
jgi:hypothetical protein